MEFHRARQPRNRRVLHRKVGRATWIEVTTDAVREKLRDPQSARFRSVVFHTYQGNSPIVCGEVSSKNGFGGFSGYRRFIASGKKFVFIEPE